MKNILFSTMLLILTGIVTSCAGIQPDYVPPSTAPVAVVEVKSSVQIYNRRVLVHGPDICSANQAKLAGLLRSKAVGVAYVESLRISVAAEKLVAISSPFSDVAGTQDTGTGVIVKTRYCQPVVSFVPKNGRTYQIDFGSCSAKLIELQNGTATAVSTSLYEGCDLGPANHDPKMFFLRSKLGS